LRLKGLMMAGTWADFMSRYFDGEPSDAEREHGVAHHGERILTRRDLGICLAMEKWIHTVRESEGQWHGKYWLPSGADFEKSRLFWRIRSGKEPLPHRPPTAYSCPWYELIDEPERPHWAFDHVMSKGQPYFAQCRYELVSLKEGTAIPERVKFGPWTFRCWEGPNPNGGNYKGWWLQLEAPSTDEDAPVNADA
jgi:hypothetical protein